MTKRALIHNESHYEAQYRAQRAQRIDEGMEPPGGLRCVSRGDFTEKEIVAMEKEYRCHILRPPRS